MLSLLCRCHSLLQSPVSFPTVVIAFLCVVWQKFCSLSADQPLPLYHERHHHIHPTATRRSVPHPTATSVKCPTCANASAKRQDAIGTSQESDHCRAAPPPYVRRPSTVISHTLPVPTHPASTSFDGRSRVGSLGMTFSLASAGPCAPSAYLNRGPTAGLPRVS